jgi:hypothetical protein
MALHVIALIIVFLSGGFAALKAQDPTNAATWTAVVAGLGAVSTLFAALGPSIAPLLAKLFKRSAVDATKLLGLLCVALMLALASGCISTAPTGPVTAVNQAQVATCQSVGSAHNDLVFAGLILGGAAPVLGGVSAGLSDTTAKTDLAISTAVTAGVAGVLTALSAYTASEFASAQCGQVVGPLPPVPLAKPLAPSSLAPSSPPATTLFPQPGESIVIVSSREEVRP